MNQPQYFIYVGLHSRPSGSARPSAPLWSRLGSCLAAEEVPHQKHQIRRTLGQPPHEIRIPGVAKWHIQAQPVPIRNQTALQIPPDPVEHLKLEAIRRN